MQGQHGFGLVFENMITIKLQKVKEKDLTVAPPPTFIL